MRLRQLLDLLAEVDPYGVELGSGHREAVRCFRDRDRSSSAPP
jgi:hypothetical protein